MPNNPGLGTRHTGYGPSHRGLPKHRRAGTALQPGTNVRMYCTLNETGTLQHPGKHNLAVLSFYDVLAHTED